MIVFLRGTMQNAFAFVLRLCLFMISIVSAVPCYSDSSVLPASRDNLGPIKPRFEIHRILIENIPNGKILGSRDKGQTWAQIGTVLLPIRGGVWQPSNPNVEDGGGVKAFDYLRGPSNIFASAVNNLHIRFSDPEGYSLPEDINIQPLLGRGVSFAPANEFPQDIEKFPKRIGVVSNHGGEGLFGEWSPRVGSKVFYGIANGNQSHFQPIPYTGVVDTNPSFSTIAIVTESNEFENIDYFEFENTTNGHVFVKYPSTEAVAIAKVLKPVSGVGRFSGSEYVARPGVLRANHAGVVCIGTTDVNTDKSIPKGTPIAELRGGFQIVPSHHWQDESMNSGGDHASVYMVVGPLQDPPDLKRYDRGIEGTYPLFYNGMNAGQGQTYFQFRNQPEWIEIGDAVRRGFFRQKDGKVIAHLRAHLPDVLKDVTAIRFYPNR